MTRSFSVQGIMDLNNKIDEYNIKNSSIEKVDNKIKLTDRQKILSWKLSSQHRISFFAVKLLAGQLMASDLQ